MPILAYRCRTDGAVLAYSSGLRTWICEIDPFPTYIATFPLAEQPKPSSSTRQNNERQQGGSSHSKGGTKMSSKFLERQSTRREMLHNSAAFAGSALLAQLI